MIVDPNLETINGTKSEIELKGRVATFEDIRPIIKNFPHDGIPSLYIRTGRESGTTDFVPVYPTKSTFQIIDSLKYEKGDVYLNGMLTTRNRKDLYGRSHLALGVSLTEKYTTVDENAVVSDINNVKISGYICKMQEPRLTPFNRKIIDFMLAVNFANGHSTYIPCILWGRNADNIYKLCKVGDPVSVVGRFQSRVYEKGLQDGTKIKKIAYEISCSGFSSADLACQGKRTGSKNIITFNPKYCNMNGAKTAEDGNGKK